MQIATAPVLVGSAFAIVILASVIPIIRNADLNISGWGPFTQRAEVRSEPRGLASVLYLCLECM